MFFYSKAVALKEKGSLMDLVDPRLGSEFNKREAARMIEIALLCINKSPALRPTMSEVVDMLEGRNKIKEPETSPTICNDELNFHVLKVKTEEIQSHDSNEAQSFIEPSSSSLHDLYQ